ncbi:hypothetical protein AGLY_001073 [Aphis glycines]|uniref:EF-hand domain-containing protein n=1 Tax=Aphis glycines TaxID=307491 RepID=A0A6G0U9U1_APHGL|nr:hypothetical protein AGLY_001073 [Aphis glycines]
MGKISHGKKSQITIIKYKTVKIKDFVPVVFNPKDGVLVLEYLLKKNKISKGFQIFDDTALGDTGECRQTSRVSTVLVVLFYESTGPSVRNACHRRTTPIFRYPFVNLSFNSEVGYVTFPISDERIQIRGLSPKQRLVLLSGVISGVRIVEAVEKMLLISCITNEENLTGSEFVKILSLVLKGKLPDLINFCFEVYTEMTRSPKFIKKEGVLLMAKRNSLKMCKLVNMEKFDQSFVDFVMIEVDKDRDNRISLEDYRKAVYENVAWLQFLGRILPTSTRKEKFMKLFTNRPYINNIQTSVSAMTREKRRNHNQK